MSRNGRAVIRLPAPYGTHRVVLKDSAVSEMGPRWDEDRTSDGKQDISDISDVCDISSEGQFVTTYLHIS
jgi:hypothetical protein